MNRIRAWKETRKYMKCVDCFIDAKGHCTAKCKLSGLERQARMFELKTILDEHK